MDRNGIGAARRGGLACVRPAWLAAGLAAAALLGGCGQSDKRAPVSYESESWRYGRSEGHKLTTEHYEIYTTIDDEVLLDSLPDFVEAAFANYQGLAPSSHVPDERMKIFLFASRSHWESFTRRWTGPRSETFLMIRNGGYVERGVAVIEYVAHQITFPLFAHEGWHQYLHYYVQPGIPAWLNEGLAVYCEGQRWGFEGIKEFDPWYNPTRRNQLADAIQRSRLHSLPRLLETHPGEVIHETSQSVSTYYAQVWALMLFLRHGADGKYAEGYQRLLSRLSEVDLQQHARAAQIWSEGRGSSYGEALFRSFISEDVDTVEREYRAFMRERFLGKS